MRITGSISFLTLLLSGTPIAHAAEWKIEPVLQLSGGYNDNIRLSTNNEISSATGVFSPSSTFSVATPTAGASGKVRFDFERYTEDSDLDENNSLVNLDLYQSFERSRLGLDLAYINDTTLDSQLEETGLVLDRIRRSRISASPSWTWLMDERSNLSASYSYSDVEYKNPGTSGFVNYTLNNGQLSLTRTLNERSAATVSLARVRSDNDNDVKSTNTNLQGGVAYQFSETLSASLFAGGRRTEVDYSRTSFVPVFSGSVIIGYVPLTAAVTNSDWGYIFNIGITKKFLRGETSVSASRDISNDINGTPIEVNRLRWNNLYRFSETFSGHLNLELYNSQYSNAFGQNLDRNYYSVQPELTWQFARFWSLTGSYRYRVQTYSNSNDDATQNAAYLTLTYLWPRIAVSR